MGLSEFATGYQMRRMLWCDPRSEKNGRDTGLSVVDLLKYAVMNRAAENPAPRENGRVKRRQLRLRCTFDGTERRQWERLSSHHCELRYWGGWAAQSDQLPVGNSIGLRRIQSSQKSVTMFAPIASG